MIFVFWDIVDGRGEFYFAGFALDLASQGFSQRKQASGGKRSDVATGKFRFDFAKLVADGVDADGSRGEPFFAERLLLNGFEVLDLEPMFAAPIDEGWARDIQLGHDFGIGPAGGAEGDETVLNLWVVHNLFFLPAAKLRSAVAHHWRAFL